MSDEDKLIAELKAENAKLKTQYNCYACGNCKGKEDYINLERHHIGLRKQFDKKVQTLQEIKVIAETAINGGYTTKSSDYSEGMEIIGHYVMQKITRAEEE